jgi:hypothetical protein
MDGKGERCPKKKKKDVHRERGTGQLGVLGEGKSESVTKFTETIFI